MSEPSDPARRDPEMDERYAQAFAVSPDAISVTDMATGRYVDINASFERLFRFRRDQLIGRTSMEIGIWADPNDRTRLIDKLQAKGVVENFLAVGRCSDGHLKTCSLAGTVVAIAGRPSVVLVVRDISEQLAAERSLRMAAERFEKLFQASPDAVALTELETGLLVECNDGFCELYEYSREHIEGRTTIELGLWINLADRQRFVGELNEKGHVRELEFRGRTGKGRIRTLVMSGELIEFQGRTCVMTVVRDVTEQRLAEAREHELEQQLMRAQKLEALGTLAGGIAHDFNNILTAILAYTEFTLMDPSDADLVRQNLQEVRKGAFRARDLVKQILAFSRHQKQERAPVDLRIPVREALLLLRSTLPSTIEIEEVYPPEPMVVLADAGQMHQVVMNLCTNAAHAMDGREGHLRVALEVVPEESRERVALPGAQRARQAKITVSDNGCGMDEPTLKRIFEPFFTTKEPGVGTGLGLSVVHGIVHSHDGSIDVKSTPGVGTEFRIHLPMKDGEVAERAAPQSEMPRGAGERILLIDDEQAICEFGKRLLTRLGYRVTTCTNPIEALELFAPEVPEFDLLITDLTMPHMTGVELVTRVHARHARMPVILMTGYSGAWTPERIAEAGVEEMLGKPLTLAVLASAVRRALDRSVES